MFQTQKPTPQLILQSKNPDERRVNELFFKIGLDVVAVDQKYYSGKQEIGEIDSIFKHENFVFLVETKNMKKLKSAYIAQFYDKWSSMHHLGLVSQEHAFARCEYRRVFVDLAHNNPGSDPVLKPCLNAENHVLYADDFAIIEENFDLVGEWERNNLFRRLRVRKQPSSSLKVDAVLCYISGKPTCLFALPVDILLACSTITRRYTHDTGYQRSLVPKRIATMRKRIKDGSITAFPNTILVNSETPLHSATPVQNYKFPLATKIDLPTDYSFLKVIDGQHRLLAFSKFDAQTQSKHDLAVMAFCELTREEETDLFVEINTAQKKVDPSLVLILKSDYADSSSHKYWYDRVGVEIVAKLNDSLPLKNKIYMGYAGRTRKGTTVTLKTLVSTIKQNRFIGRRNLFQVSPTDVAGPLQTISKVFQLVHDRSRNSQVQRDWKEFFLESKGIRILLRYIQMYERNARLAGRQNVMDEAVDYLWKALDRPLLDQVKVYAGLQGVSKAVEDIIGKLRSVRSFPFSNFECDLNRLPYVCVLP